LIYLRFSIIIIPLLFSCGHHIKLVPHCPQKYVLSNLSYISQGKNECGIASMAMVLSYYGIQKNKSELYDGMHFDKKNGVTPGNMKKYPRAIGLESRAYSWWNGTIDRIVENICQGRPVIVRQWYNEAFQIKKWSAHYRVVVGYDLEKQEFYVLDPVAVDPAGYTVIDFTTFMDRWDLMTHPSPTFNWMLVIWPKK
jgi:ABC-type bacteriocin/lantibiotic exporter with double-glycine peptidase domain